MTIPITLDKVDGEAAVDRIETLLKANDLPYQDVRSKPDCFFLAYSGTNWIGCGGVETYGSDGLLRSVVIKKSDRGQGYGTKLYGELEDHTRTDGIQTLYLLTTTAAEFFRDRGYEEISREATPPRIQQTAEFTNLCPDSATCMKKTLV